MANSAQNAIGSISGQDAQLRKIAHTATFVRLCSASPTFHKIVSTEVPQETAKARLDWIRAQQDCLWRYLRLLGAGPDEIEDLMQDAFVALFTNYGDRDAASQARLLRTIAGNRFVDTRRHDRRKTAEWSDLVDSWLAATEDRPLTNQHGEELDACLAELTQRAQEALTLHNVDGLTIEQVGARFDLRRTGTLTLLQRSRDLLRACLRRRGVHTENAPKQPNRRSTRSHA